MKNYRQVWEKEYGKIPKGYEIHHIDGDRSNNDISNLKCVSIDEHYNIHYEQGDYNACVVMSARMKLTVEEKSILMKQAAENDGRWKGENNYWYGKSTSHFVKEIWDNRSDERRKEIGNKVSKTRKERKVANGKNNPMYGRSAVKEQNLKWYNNGIINKYIPENTQPEGFTRGRLTKWSTRKKI